MKITNIRLGLTYDIDGKRYSAGRILDHFDGKFDKAYDKVAEQLKFSLRATLLSMDEETRSIIDQVNVDNIWVKTKGD